MSWLNLLGISVGLAMDALAVSIAAGLSIAKVTPRHTFRIAFHFGLFQFLMPVVGWLAGQRVARFLGGYQPWVAFGLLAAVGGKMLLDSFAEKRPGTSSDPSRGLMLVTLSVATSIDALAVGISLALVGTSVWTPAVVIGLVAAAFSAVGIQFGARLGSRLEHWAEALGGCVLLLIGLRILVAHLAG